MLRPEKWLTDMVKEELGCFLQANPLLGEAYQLKERFLSLVAYKDLADLDAWLSAESGLSVFRRLVRSLLCGVPDSVKARSAASSPSNARVKAERNPISSVKECFIDCPRRSRAGAFTAHSRFVPSSPKSRATQFYPRVVCQAHIFFPPSFCPALCGPLEADLPGIRLLFPVWIRRGCI